MQMKPKLRCAGNAVHLPECDDCSALEARVDIAEENIEVLEGKVSQNETDIDTLDTRVGQNDSSISSLNNTASSLDSRVTALEQGGGSGGDVTIYRYLNENPTTSDENAGAKITSDYLNRKMPVICYTPSGSASTRYLYLVSADVGMGGYTFIFQSQPDASGNVYALSVGSNSGSTARRVNPIGGAVTHVLDNEGTLNMTASQILNAMGTSSVYVVTTETVERDGTTTTYTNYSPVGATISDGTMWVFVAQNAVKQSMDHYVANSIYDYPVLNNPK